MDKYLKTSGATIISAWEDEDGVTHALSPQPLMILLERMWVNLDSISTIDFAHSLVTLKDGTKLSIGHNKWPAIIDAGRVPMRITNP